MAFQVLLRLPSYYTNTGNKNSQPVLYTGQRQHSSVPALSEQPASLVNPHG
ncbi:rCG39409 [Rattus norvegicus]|uniref:RCG39409 n=1 Tax=Rattus norvegicus TaxID=10116 RepID=A6I891_RAT|nr:rCG39409 [Rattus norvegicus]